MERPIIREYPGYEACYLAFHPFLKIKEASKSKIQFEFGRWPEKRSIVEHCDALSWSEFVRMSGIESIQRVAYTLDWFHRSTDHGDRDDVDRLLDLLYSDEGIVAPQPDEIPAIIEKNLAQHLLSLGYETIALRVWSDDAPKAVDLNDLTGGNAVMLSNARITTPDGRYLIVTDFDCCHSYFLGSRMDIERLVQELDLEGFYCTPETTGSWSYCEVPPDKQVDWHYRSPAM
ncbi:MAG: DUF2711 family protein [Flavobacteriales bacterium]|nr:DUF2711 family protein [Flavobacteriales bacterium]